LDILNIIKIITTIITGVIALIIGLRVLFLNKNDLLNIWFALSFVSTSIGFIIYAIYHSILNNAAIIIPLMITGQIFFNFNTIAITMTLVVLEKHRKVSMSLKYLGSMLILFFVMNIEEDISKVSRSQQNKAFRVVRITLTHPDQEQINNIFKVLCKDTNQVMNSLRELLYLELDQKRKKVEFLRVLHPLLYFPSKGKIVSKLQSDEVHYFSDSDYL
jgi:hypothetical protein